MKCIIVSLLLLVGCNLNQNIYYTNPQSIVVNNGDTVDINTLCSLTFYNKGSSLLACISLRNNNTSVQLTDSIDMSPYESRVHVFENKESRSFVIIWETRYELQPVTLGYYITEDRIIRLGELPITAFNDAKDDWIFPIQSLSIHKGKRIIGFAFADTVCYKNGEEDMSFLTPEQSILTYDLLSQKMALSTILCNW